MVATPRELVELLEAMATALPSPKLAINANKSFPIVDPAVVGTRLYVYTNGHGEPHRTH
jgi:hypothetical protein